MSKLTCHPHEAQKKLLNQTGLGGQVLPFEKGVAGGVFSPCRGNLSHEFSNTINIVAFSRSKV